jgi:hypothetical protein
VRRGISQLPNRLKIINKSRLRLQATLDEDRQLEKRKRKFEEGHILVNKTLPGYRIFSRSLLKSFNSVVTSTGVADSFICSNIPAGPGEVRISKENSLGDPHNEFDVPESASSF